MDQLDREIINRLQQGFPVCEKPYAEIAKEFSISETTLLNRLRKLLDDGELSRFGPMFNLEKMGGAYSLVAMEVPEKQFDETATIVNDFPEVAHNYKRQHPFNLWFVVAARKPERVESVLHEIEIKTGMPVYNMPKLKEYCLGARFDA